MRRKNEPFGGYWATPGGFVDEDETLAHAVARELEEETGVQGIDLLQFHTFGDPGRDPRGRAITTAYLALVNAADHSPRAADDADAVRWCPVNEARGLAFDHDRIVAGALAQLRIFASYTGIGAQTVPARFALDTLRRVYETVEERHHPSDAFLARLSSQGIVEPDGNSGLYRFAVGRVAAL